MLGAGAPLSSPQGQGAPLSSSGAGSPSPGPSETGALAWALRALDPSGIRTAMAERVEGPAREGCAVRGLACQ